MMKIVYKITATALGSGYSPFAPGTAGALVGCIALWIFEKYNIVSTTSTPILFIGLILITTVLGIIATDKLEDEWGKDPSKVVIDEVVGVWIAMMFIPFSLLNILLAFGLFRFFDIANACQGKPIKKIINSGKYPKWFYEEKMNTVY